MCYVADVTTSLTQRELRNQSGQIIRALDAGDSFVVTRNGVPVGELTPIRPRRYAPRNTVLATFSSAPALNAARFRDEVDEVVDQRPEPRG